LGNLNSGLQLYYLKEEKPAVFNKIHTSLHLPQYMSYLVTDRLCSDITSIGCHTALWNFTKNHYHEWLQKEGIAEILAPIFPSDQLMTTNWNDKPLLCGAGLHDSSAALIPYLAGFSEPFVLISTGTWCISFHPFNQSKLTAAELNHPRRVMKYVLIWCSSGNLTVMVTLLSVPVHWLLVIIFLP